MAAPAWTAAGRYEHIEEARFLIRGFERHTEGPVTRVFLSIDGDDDVLMPLRQGQYVRFGMAGEEATPVQHASFLVPHDDRWPVLAVGEGWIEIAAWLYESGLDGDDFPEHLIRPAQHVLHFSTP